jgi:anti-sigma regulatory factor (Ser/Thr protein kinase)
MPASADTARVAHDHVVKFYADDHDLTSVVVAYLAAALVEGDAVIVIAAPRHREAFRAGLASVGVDVEAARRDGRLHVVDAEDALSRIMVGGAPDPAAFDAVVGSLVRQAGATTGVRAYGEMVALLWDAGNVVGAIDLERLWNRLQEETSFSLLCAYACAAADALDGGDGFSEVCRLHSDVVVNAPSPSDAEQVRSFPRVRHAPRDARAFVADALRAFGCAELIDDAVLVVSELATNAMVHGRSDFTVSVTQIERAVTIAVGDAGAGPPARRRARASSTNGRGLQLVAGVASSWGVTPHTVGKVVWANLSTASSAAVGNIS